MLGFVRRPRRDGPAPGIVCAVGRCGTGSPRPAADPKAQPPRSSPCAGGAQPRPRAGRAVDALWGATVSTLQ
jgi:hypothetical protein